LILGARVVEKRRVIQPQMNADRHRWKKGYDRLRNDYWEGLGAIPHYLLAARMSQLLPASSIASYFLPSRRAMT
jgi:hypothetical protein